ncbi:TonB-dependent receptor [Fulvivirga sediminis]|nr:TonB-dependent receptor [Fulvivirga sediminis]
MAQAKIWVMDVSSGQPISDVLIKGNGFILTTDSNGMVLRDITTKVKVYLSHVSYYPQYYHMVPEMADTLYLTPNELALNEVVVHGFEMEKSLLEQPGAMAHLSGAQLMRFNENSMVDAFNTVAGVRMEERAPNSYRISIRGSSLRAPFGVRNVKVYWNDIPYTSPDGTTGLNLLDLSNISDVDIIKGPAGSIYGAGNGGVIRLNNDFSTFNKGMATAEYMIGAFGLYKYRLALQQPLKNGSLAAAYVKQKSDGFRNQSASEREVFQWSNRWDLDNDNSLTFNLLYTDLYYELPGALTAEQVEDDRTQARPGSEELNASIRQKALFSGMSYDYSLGKHWKTTTSGYITTSDFDDPFNTDYKKETQFGYGGRTSVSFEHTLGKHMNLNWVSGGEYQYSKTSADNFGNVGGRPDTLRFSDDLFVKQYFLFTQAEIQLPYDLSLTVGISQNYLNYDINRKADMATGKAYDRERNFEPVWVPRVALLKKIGINQALRATVSYGFSPPTIDEVRTNEGSINLNLNAEKGTNYEIGYRGTWWNSRLNTDLTLFYFELDETITTYTSPEGVTLFRNAGRTDQKGVEVSVGYDIIRKPEDIINLVHLEHSYTGHFFKFKDYLQKENDYSGNDLTGVAPNTCVNTLDVQTRMGVYLNVTHQFTDEIPLNDGNTVYQDSYHLLSGRLGWRKAFSNQWNFEIFTGIENGLDQKYSRGNDLNPYGQRYYQPALGINGYGGVKLVFTY